MGFFQESVHFHSIDAVGANDFPFLLQGCCSFSTSERERDHIYIFQGVSLIFSVAALKGHAIIILTLDLCGFILFGNIGYTYPRILHFQAVVALGVYNLHILLLNYCGLVSCERGVVLEFFPRNPPVQAVATLGSNFHPVLYFRLFGFPLELI